MGLPLIAGGLIGGSLLKSLFGRRRRGQSPEQLAAQQAEMERINASRNAANTAQTAEQQRQAEEAARRDRELQQFNQMLGNVRNTNMSIADQVLSSYGLDPNMFRGNVQTELDRLTAGLRPGSDPTNIINGRSIAESVVNDELRRRRMGYQQQAEQKFGSNFGNRLISDDVLNSTIDDILNTQKQNAAQFIERGQKRGIINDVGAQAAQRRIGEAEQTGRGTLGNLALGIIDKYRSQANQVRDRAFNQASGYNFGSNINFDELLGEGNQIAERARNFGGGELRSAIGGQNFFDLSELRNTAGQAQGAINPRDTEVANAIANRRRMMGTSRGIGNQGAL
jgi:hypothetical protein